jgi:hypothetical protein
MHIKEYFSVILMLGVMKIVGTSYIVFTCAYDFICVAHKNFIWIFNTGPVWRSWYVKKLEPHVKVKRIKNKISLRILLRSKISEIPMFMQLNFQRLRLILCNANAIRLIEIEIIWCWIHLTFFYYFYIYCIFIVCTVHTSVIRN